MNDKVCSIQENFSNSLSKFVLSIFEARPLMPVHYYYNSKRLELFESNFYIVNAKLANFLYQHSKYKVKTYKLL